MDELLRFYNRELDFLRQQGKEFAAAHPKVAGRLRLGDSVEDPHVSRLLEGVALLNARLRQKIDDDLPELVEGLINNLYPHYLGPIPSAGIVQIIPNESLKEPLKIERNDELHSEPVDDVSCRFRVTQPAQVWPIDVREVSLRGRPFQAPAGTIPDGAAAVLHVRIGCTGDGVTFAALQPHSLRFFLSGPAGRSFPLYELIMSRLQAVVVATGLQDPAPIILAPATVRPIGFDPQELLLPQRAGAFVGYGLLTEFFALPERFLFFEVDGLGARTIFHGGTELSLYFFLSEGDRELERGVTREDFSLGCVPIVNLFQKQAEPWHLEGTAYEKKVLPDATRPDAFEIHGIERIGATRSDGSIYEFAPLWGLHHGAGERYWTARRVPSPRVADAGSDIIVSLIERDGLLSDLADHVISIDLLCTNRNLPTRLPAGGGHPVFSMATPTPAVKGIRPILPLSAPRPAAMRADNSWRLLSHLSVNRLSLVDGPRAADSLRELLNLYEPQRESDSRSMLEGLVSVSGKRAIARVVFGETSAITHGVEVDLVLDPRFFPAGQAFLLGSVLEAFFSAYVTVNAFTRTTLRYRGSADAIKRWPPRIGARIII